MEKKIYASHVSNQNNGFIIAVTNLITEENMRVLRWDSSKAYVLKCAKLQRVSPRELLRHDLIEMWTFRDGDDNLCLIIGTKLDLNLSL
ncbi:hypothetical protein KFK09_014751 [Dendrobium nobile]|uniref:Uncharacterized protein n=1 Tax=Dendrobium nobile TaxID=94219 RepID=A0A8T3B407_DENNO|nr:hypothetical protein KFK09_014751 [Dendrobium nobile]